jgi:hypothetical protein
MRRWAGTTARALAAPRDRVIVWHVPMHQPEIVLAFTKPETEWVRGRALPKMSPTRDHARAQLLFGAALDRWAKRRGEVGTEWHFRIQPTHGSRRPLVPDLAFVSSFGCVWIRSSLKRSICGHSASPRSTQHRRKGGEINAYFLNDNPLAISTGSMPGTFDETPIRAAHVARTSRVAI